MRKSHYFMILLLFCVSLTSSCVIAVIDYSGSNDSMPGEQFRETLPFSEGGLRKRSLRGSPA